MSKSEPICSPFTRHLKLSFKQCPLCDEEKKKDEEGYLCIHSWLLNLCHSLQKARYSSYCWCG